MTLLVVLTVLDIVLLIAGLACYLWWVGSLLARIATNLEECAGTVRTINGHAALIVPGVTHINRTGAVVAGALPLLYGMAEDIVRAAPEAGRRSGPSGIGHPPLAPARRRRLRTALSRFAPFARDALVASGRCECGGAAWC